MGIIVLIIVALVLFYIVKQHLRKRSAKRAVAYDLGVKVHKALDKINNSSTISTRLNNCGKAIQLLMEISLLDPKCKVVTNRIELLEKLQSLKKVIPVGKFIDRYEKCMFKKQNKQALNALLDAIYHCNQVGMSENDFKITDFRDNMGQPISLSGLKDKAKNLGWEG